MTEQPMMTADEARAAFAEIRAGMQSLVDRAVRLGLPREVAEVAVEAKFREMALSLGEPEAKA